MGTSCESVGRVEVVLRDLCFELGREEVGSVDEAAALLSDLGYRWSGFAIPGVAARLALGRRTARVYVDGIEVTAALRSEPTLDPRYLGETEGPADLGEGFGLDDEATGEEVVVGLPPRARGRR